MPTKRRPTHGNRKKGLAFCTECGDSLQELWLDPNSVDVQAALKRMANCKVEGKFHGNFCARLWIAGSDSFQRPRKLPQIPRKKVDALKDSIRTNIKRTEGGDSPPARVKGRRQK